MNYEETLEYIHGVNWMECEPGTQREEELLSYIGNPEKELKYVHIAGTNGKGSTAAMTASVLSAAGYKTGLFTSPHIIEFNERCQINGEYISNEDLCDIVEYIKPFADKMKEPPTEFELISAIGFEYFKRKKCDIVVLEVGLGGVMDSTNVIPAPVVAVIAAIGLDHTGLLGNTVEEIAKEKAGIIKKGCDAVIYSQKESVEQVCIDICKKRDVKYYITENEKMHQKSFDLDGQTVDYAHLKDLLIPLTGSYQLKNAALVLKIIEVLKLNGYKISDNDIKKGLANTKWPSRFEVLSKNPVFIVDGAHNPQGIKATSESLLMHFPDKKIIFIMGVMADKDFESMLPFITPMAKEFITVTPEYESRALNADSLTQYLRPYGVEVIECGEVENGIKEALKRAGQDGVICALGSLYLSGDIKKII